VIRAQVSVLGVPEVRVFSMVMLLLGKNTPLRSGIILGEALQDLGGNILLVMRVVEAETKKAAWG
jgi:hypothetical protein